LKHAPDIIYNKESVIPQQQQKSVQHAHIIWT